jgi:predicted nucleic acid-binding protein
MRRIEDTMVASTAAVHNRTVGTRNVGGFEPFGVATLNPFR